MEVGCGWLINKLLEYTKIKQRIFKAIPLAFIICVILDVISICIFISTRNYIILQFVYLVAEIVSDYGYYKYLYLPCKNKVFETWNKEESTHE